MGEGGGAFYGASRMADASDRQGQFSVCRTRRKLLEMFR